MHNGLLNKHFLITGASSGIGRQTARYLAEHGARVALVARNTERLAETGAMLPGGSWTSHPFDLAQTDETPKFLQRVASDAGSLDGLVHCAGVHMTKPLRMVTARDVEETMRINVGSALALAKGFLQKNVRSAATGSIVFVSSVVGLLGQPGLVVYSATKGALIAATKTLALELARDRVRVNCVAPAVVRTEMFESLKETLSDDQLAAIEKMHPLGLGLPADVAYAIAFLLNDEARWITGTTLVVDGGYSAQ